VIRQAQGLSERRACRRVGMARTSCRYARQRPGQEENLKARLRTLAGERRRFGYRRLTVLLRREGWGVNHKRVYRLYRQEGLGVRRRKCQRIGAVERQPLAIPTRQNERWSMDFIADALSEGRKFRSLNIVDDFNRECLAAGVQSGASTFQLGVSDAGGIRGGRGRAASVSPHAGGNPQDGGECFLEFYEFRISQCADLGGRSVTQGSAGGGPSSCFTQSLLQVEDPSIIYEVGIASTARAEGILPPGIVASGKRR